jgi:hypothetical protein
MGCDIHGFVEYATFETQDGPYWDCLISNVGHRDYTFFSLIADCGRGEHAPVVPNRGLPEGKCSWEVERYMWITVTDDEKLGDEEGFCSRKQAAGWGEIKRKVIPQRNGPDHVYERVLNPDLHSHTWLTCDELARVIAAYITETHEDYPYGVEWDATLAAMRALEERGFKTRLVVAFDN